MIRALFISDIHISSPEDPKLLLFQRLLEQCEAKGVNQIFFVGDIFDFWISDRQYFTTSYAKLIEQVRRLVVAGVRVHYFEGNHDLDLRRYWQRQIGVSVHEGASYFHVGKTLVRVEHGDQMDPEDYGYRLLRWLLRTPVLVILGRILPEFVIRSIGSKASAASRKYTSSAKAVSDQVGIDKIRRHARSAYAKRPFNIFVSGHVHIHEDSIQKVRDASFRCINLGTWLKQPLLLDIQGTDVTLREVEEFIQS